MAIGTMGCMSAQLLASDRKGPKRRGTLLAFATILACCAGALGSIKLGYRQTVRAVETKRKLKEQLPRLEREQAYVSSNQCQACHPGAHATWHRSFHRSMTQTATPQNVAGDFGDSDAGVSVDSNGLEYRVFQRGDTFWAEMPDPDQLMYAVQGGKRIDSLTYLVRRNPRAPIEKLDLRTLPRVERQVVMTTGSHHYQTYWVQGDPKYGRLLQTLPLVYLIDDQRWIPRENAFMYPPDSLRMVTQWNHHCIRCHSTGANPGLNQDTGKFDTAVAELGISCEACHGPGEQHVKVNQDPLRRYRLKLSGEADPTIVNPARLGHEASSHICGQCHGVYVMKQEYGLKYAEEGVQFRPGDNLFDTRYYIMHPARVEGRDADMQQNPDFFRARWWDDGTVVAGGREFTAMSVSKCYTEGEISCISCHTMHGDKPADQLRPEARSNEACTQCHSESVYTSDIAEHSHHPAASEGSQCVNCHMPRTAYALFDAIRNHEIAVPNLKASAVHGVPNACNLCHLDQTLAWTDRWMVEWYGSKSVFLTTEQKETAAGPLWLLKGDAAQRAIAAWHFGWTSAIEASSLGKDDWATTLLAPVLADPYAVVRYITARSIRQLGRELEFDFMQPPNERQRVIEKLSAEPAKYERAPSRYRTLILDEAGEIDRMRLRQMVRQRNDRPVTISE